MQGGQSAAVCGVGGPHGKLICTLCQDREILLTLLREIREGRVAIAVGRNDRPWCRVHKRSQGSIIPVVASARGCNYCARSARWPTSVAACTMGGTRGPLGGLRAAATAVSSCSPWPSLAARPGGLLTPATDPYPGGLYAHLVSFVTCWTMSGSQRESTSSYSTDTQ